MFYAQRFDVISDGSQRLEGVDEREAEGEYKAKRGGDDEGHDLIVGQGGREEADGDECCAQEDQAEVGAPCAAHVNVTHRVAQKIDGNDIYQCWQQCNDQQGKAREELRPNDLHVGQGFGQQQVHRARAAFFRKRAHRYGRHQE